MAFFTNAAQLASLFTAPAPHNPERQGKYLPGGLKPIEAFCNDILTDLKEWSFDGSSIFYKTSQHWYEFRFNREQKIIEMTRYDNTSWRRMDDWANPGSLRDMGKDWLLKEPQKSKFVPMFETWEPK
jgi:hypothetical protein